MAIRDTVRRFADRLGIPSFQGTPFPDGNVEQKQQLRTELGGTGTLNFGGFLRGEDFNPEMDSLTAIKNLDVMRRSDAQTNAAISVVMQPIRSADRSVDAAEGQGDGGIDDEVAEFVEWNLFGGESIVWDDFLRQALLMIVFGHYVFEKVWDLQQDGPYAGKVYYRKLAPRPPKTIWQWFTDESGELLSIKQLAVKAGTYQFLDIPASKLVVFVYNKEGDNYAGMSILRSAYPHWLIKNNLYVVDAIRAVRFGAGIPRAKLLKGYAPNKQEADNLVATLMGMSSHQFSYIIQPEDVEIDILVPQGAQGGAQILPTINHHNEQITRNVMASFLDMGGKSMGGSNALGSSAMEFFSNAEVSLSKLVEDVINKQVIRPLVDANYDVNQLRGYPTFRFSGIKQDNLKDIAGIVTSLAGAGMTFTDTETQNTFRGRLGLPEVDDDVIAAAAPQPPVPAGGTPADGSSDVDPSSALAPRTPPTNQNPQSARSAVPVGGKAASATKTGVDHSATARTNGVGKTVANSSATDSTAAVSNAPRSTEAVSSVSKGVPPTAKAARSATASSGVADEEDHSSLKTTTQKKPKQTTTKPSHVAASDPETQGTLTFWRAPTELENRVLDLREMPAKLDTARTALLATLRDVREEQVLRIAELLAQGGKTQKAPLVGKLTSDVLKITKGVFQYGHQSVETELQKQGVPREAGPVKKVHFTEPTPDMPFPVDLTPFPEPDPIMVQLAPVVRMDLSNMVATQASLTQRRVLPDGVDSSLPILVRHEGVDKIYDGHHRLSSAKRNGAKQAKVRLVAMAERAFAGDNVLPHLEASIKLKVQSAGDRLVSSGAAEALRLKRAGWEVDEIEDALKIHLGELSEGDIARLANMAINEAFSLGRTAAATANKDIIGSATYSALMDGATCDVCEKLDEKVFELDSDEYEENLPPNVNCKGQDACRCLYIYTVEGDLEARERALGGPGSGWHKEQGHISHKDQSKVLKTSKEKAFNGKAVEASTRLSKLETGQLGEQLATAWLQKQGFADARSLNVKGNNFPVDLVHDHEVYEVKAGLASNSASAQHWRATIGQPGPKEAVWLAKASPAAKARWNEKKQQEIIDRKEQAVKEVSKRIGRKVSGKTLTLVIDPDRRIADIHVFNGFHSRISWNSSQAKAGYRGSFKY